MLFNDLIGTDEQCRRNLKAESHALYGRSSRSIVSQVTAFCVSRSRAAGVGLWRIKQPRAGLPHQPSHAHKPHRPVGV